MSHAFTPEELSVLKSIYSGRDVFDRAEALFLRELERATPPLVVIADTPNEFSPIEQHPFFWATVTGAGLVALVVAGCRFKGLHRPRLCHVDACRKPLIASTCTGEKPVCDECWATTPPLLQMAWAAMSAFFDADEQATGFRLRDERHSDSPTHHISQWHKRQRDGGAP